MTTKDDGGPAFPVIPPLGPDGTSAVGYPFVGGGMSLRDYFAAKAMPAMYGRVDSGGLERVAKLAYELADAMLAARRAE